MVKQRRLAVVVSDRTFAALRGSAAGHGEAVLLVRLTPGDAIAPETDAVVVEPCVFPDFLSFQSAYRALRQRVLAVSHGEAEESALLRTLDPADELIRADALEAHFFLRLDRLLSDPRLARVDLLTGLSNHRVLNQIGEALFAEGLDPDHPLSAIIADLDHFKKLNDAFGHGVGDAVLVAAARALREGAPDAQVVARFGGEEFLILLAADRELARARAESLRGAIEALEPSPGIRFTASFGVATATGGSSFQSLVAEADRCLYAAKERGRNRVVDQAEFRGLAAARDEDPDITDFDNRVRVLTQRLAEYLSQKGRSLARVFQNEAERDGLTGIYNRRYFDRRIARELELSSRPGRPLSLLFFDLDDFGAVNRDYGFPAGDRALKTVAAAIARSVRTTDWVARYGGEELCAVLPDTPLAEAAATAERVLSAIRKLEVVSVGGRIFRVTASVGVVASGGEAPPIPEFVQRASDKVREAKKAGKDRAAY